MSDELHVFFIRVKKNARLLEGCLSRVYTPNYKERNLVEKEIQILLFIHKLFKFRLKLEVKEKLPFYSNKKGKKSKISYSV